MIVMISNPTDLSTSSTVGKTAFMVIVLIIVIVIVIVITIVVIIIIAIAIVMVVRELSRRKITHCSVTAII